MGARRVIGRLAGVLALTSGAAVACPTLEAATGETAGEGYVIAFATTPDPAPLAAPFALDAVVCGPRGPYAGALRVDADMPLHRHGMNYAPTVTSAASGRFRADGMLFHMPGAWRFKFVLETEAGPVRLAVPYTLE